MLCMWAARKAAYTGRWTADKPGWKSWAQRRIWPSDQLRLIQMIPTPFWSELEKEIFPQIAISEWAFMSSDMPNLGSRGWLVRSTWTVLEMTCSAIDRS